MYSILIMDQKELQATLETTLKEVLPDVVEASVDAKMDEKVSSLEKAISDLNKSVKLGVDEEKANINEAKKSMGGFFRALAKAKSESEIAQAKTAYLNEGTDAEGGYMVPAEFAKEVFRIAGEAGIVRKYARIIPMGTDTKNISTITNTITAYWTDEGGAYTGSKPTVWQCQLVAYKVTALVSATNELIDDNMTNEEIWSLMSELIGEKIAEFEDTNVLVSSSKFTALLADTNVNITNMSTGEEFKDISYDDLVDVMRSVPVKFKKGQPRWFMSQDIVKHIEKIKDQHGEPIFYATRSLRDGQIENYLLGYPVEIVDSMPWDTTSGAEKTFLIFGDLKHWAFWDRKQLSLSVGYLSWDWEKDIQSLKANERIAWKVIFPKAFWVLKTGVASA